MTLPTLARQTGMEEKEIRSLMLQLRQLSADDAEGEISLRDMKKYIDQMNWIIKNI